MNILNDIKQHLLRYGIIECDIDDEINNTRALRIRFQNEIYDIFLKNGECQAVMWKGVIP